MLVSIKEFESIVVEGTISLLLLKVFMQNPLMLNFLSSCVGVTVVALLTTAINVKIVCDKYST